MDLSSLRPVFESEGPFVTLHVEVGRGSESAPDELDARLTTIRHRLEGEVSEGLIAELEDRLRANTHLPGEVRRTLVAAGDLILFDEVQAGHNHWPEIVDVADLPDMSGWLSLADRAIPFVLAVVDREGADISVHRALSAPPVAEQAVTGTTFHITKVAAGDWAQKQFQQTAEDAWRDNARLVADAVHERCVQHSTRTVFVAGEVRARTELIRALDHQPGVGESVIDIEAGGRAAGASDEALWAEIRDRLTGIERAADADVAEALDRGRARGDIAATGLDEVVDALAQARVERLVVDLAAMADRTVDPRRRPGLALPQPAASLPEVPADRLLVAASVLSAAQLTLLPATMAHGGGVSALLRWAS